MDERSIHHVHFHSVESTMDTARDFVLQNQSDPHDWALVTAERQSAGRGTRGRPWISALGNLYLTVIVPRAALTPVRFGLFPLETGLAMWDAAAPLLPPASRTALRLKWPNDLLWEGRKVAGMLLEATTEHIFVGVGINLTYAPEIEDGGTPSGRLADAGFDDAGALPLAKAFAENLRERLSSTAHASQVVDDWRARAQWDKPLRLRDRPSRPEVYPIDLNADGHLLVRHTDGHEEWLMSEYLS